MCEATVSNLVSEALAPLHVLAGVSDAGVETDSSHISGAGRFNLEAEGK